MLLDTARVSFVVPALFAEEEVKESIVCTTESITLLFITLLFITAVAEEDVEALSIPLDMVKATLDVKLDLL
jgi:hypothetical protein